MRRFSWAFLAIALVGVIVGASGCKTTTSTSSTGSLPTAVGSQPATQSATGTPAPRPRPQQVVLNGLIVTMRPAPIAMGGKYSIALQAENSTDATMLVPVVGNTPKLLDPSGAPAKNAIVGSGFGPGARRVAAYLTRSSKSKGFHSSSADSLPAHTYATGVIVTRYDTNGHGYTVKWDLGSGRVAVFKLK